MKQDEKNQLLLQRAMDIRQRLKKAVISRYAQSREGAFWRTSAHRLASEIDRMQICAQPWNELQADIMKIDYEAFANIHLPDKQMAMALPNISGPPGIPNTEFLIIYTPLDSDSFLFELIADLAAIKAEPGAYEEAARITGSPAQAIREKFLMPHCVGLHAGIVTIDRAQRDFYTVFNVLYVQCQHKDGEIIIRDHPSYEPFMKCSICQDFNKMQDKNPQCLLHCINVHTLAHIVIKFIQAPKEGACSGKGKTP